MQGLSNFSQDGQTPLLLAVRKRNIAVVRELLGAEVELNHMEKVRTCILSFFVIEMCICPERTLCSDVVL